jgi:hypothetical protein
MSSAMSASSTLGLIQSPGTEVTTRRYSFLGNGALYSGSFASQWASFVFVYCVSQRNRSASHERPVERSTPGCLGLRRLAAFDHSTGIHQVSRRRLIVALNERRTKVLKPDLRHKVGNTIEAGDVCFLCQYLTSSSCPTDSLYPIRSVNTAPVQGLHWGSPMRRSRLA